MTIHLKKRINKRDMPSSKTTVYLREECKKAGIPGLRKMSNKEMIEKLESKGKSVKLPEKKVPKRPPAKKKKEEEGMTIEKVRTVLRKFEEKMKGDECKHNFEKFRGKLVCTRCARESEEKTYAIDRLDMKRYQLTFERKR